MTAFLVPPVLGMKRAILDDKWEVAKARFFQLNPLENLKLTPFQEEALSETSKKRLKDAYVNALQSISLGHNEHNLAQIEIEFDRKAIDNACAQFLACMAEEKRYKESLIWALETQRSYVFNQLIQMVGRPIFKLLSQELHSLIAQLDALDPAWRTIIERLQREQQPVPPLLLMQPAIQRQSSSTQLEADDDRTASKSVEI